MFVNRIRGNIDTCDIHTVIQQVVLEYRGNFARSGISAGRNDDDTGLPYIYVSIIIIYLTSSLLLLKILFITGMLSYGDDTRCVDAKQIFFNSEVTDIVSHGGL